MKRLFRKSYSIILVLLILFIFIPVISASSIVDPKNLEDGKYEINIWAMRADNENVSSADSDLLKPSQLEVINSKLYAYITMQRADVISDFSYQNSSGDFILAEVIEENLEGESKTRTYKLPLTDLDSTTLVRVKIDRGPVMGPMTVDFRLVTDNDTLVLLELTPKPEDPASEEIEDGTYHLQAMFMHETLDQPSMANGNLVNPVTLEIKEGKIFTIFTMTGADGMTDLQVKVNSFVPVEIISEDAAANSKTYKLEVVDFDTPVTLQAHIPVIDMTVKFRMIFDLDTLVSVAPGTPHNPAIPVDANTPVTGTPNDSIYDTSNKPVEGTPSEGDNNNNNQVKIPKTGDSASFKMVIIIWGLAMVTMVKYVIRKSEALNS
ncbi:NEAT domain-containing protein [Candidatus Contubernalis alkaliaceticus]|uniref:NEAT domain-containing protein n=1 Tax=Candidatus Contubernalis alkaliaceticus TaxID=338645 RepID=UPI001F4BD9E6|nr:NEAT domain-containing protein [Candidatus Contubernalis alkalaceticus]UNC93081.1 NEAT domain-containing protein [Candidatus Contubernalis alkalaceticus]